MDFDLAKHCPDTPVFDLSSHYSDFVPFTINSIYPIHRWYPVKEGYSKDLVHLILGSLQDKPEICLDPFAGSGTTPLVCQEVSINCHSIEVNPFLHHLAKTKLSVGYTVEEFDRAIDKVRNELDKVIGDHFEEPVMSTITKRGSRKKWLFDPSVLQTLLALKHTFAHLDPTYSDLFLIILASILPEVGNTTKDGKCVRYKNEWDKHTLNREEVRDLFFKQANIFRQDIKYIENREWPISNEDLCLKGNAIPHLREYPSGSIDIVITSPPYLNSFDYTDVYMPELWVLGFVQSYEDVKQLRESTLRSHVQVKWEVNEDSIDNFVKKLIAEILDKRDNLWNEGIPDMIAGYFIDMRIVLQELKRMLRSNGMLCLVVGTSSYYKVTVPTDLIIAKIATDVGFSFEEMRIVRRLKRSTQQTTEDGRSLPSLRETLLFLRA